MDHPPPLTEQHDVLVAVANPHATRLLAIADDLNNAGTRIANWEEAVQEALDSGWGEGVVDARRRDLAHFNRQAEPLFAEHDDLLRQLYDADPELGRRIEQYVWRKR